MSDKYEKIYIFLTIMIIFILSSCYNIKTPSTYDECFCGKGKIIEERVVGFNDHYIDIICKNCLRKYHDFIDLCGNDWKIYKKK